MTRLQRWVAIGTLTLTAVFLHRVLCEWESGEHYLHMKWNERTSLVPVGDGQGIVGRSGETYGFDAIFGIAVPMMLLGGALFILVSPQRNTSVKRAAE